MIALKNFAVTGNPDEAYKFITKYPNSVAIEVETSLPYLDQNNHWRKDKEPMIYWILYLNAI
jgi:hypothetical protein